MLNGVRECFAAGERHIDDVCGFRAESFEPDRQSLAKQRREIDAESRAYKRWLDTIPGARLVTTDQSGHNVPIDQPQLVVEHIREVVRAATDRPRLQ